MSSITKAYVLERFGPQLSTAHLVQLLDIELGTLLNQISAGQFPILPTSNADDASPAMKPSRTILPPCSRNHVVRHELSRSHAAGVPPPWNAGGNTSASPRGVSKSSPFLVHTRLAVHRHRYRESLKRSTEE